MTPALMAMIANTQLAAPLRPAKLTRRHWRIEQPKGSRIKNVANGLAINNRIKRSCLLMEWPEAFLKEMTIIQAGRISRSGPWKSGHQRIQSGKSYEESMNFLQEFPSGRRINKHFLQGPGLPHNIEEPFRLKTIQKVLNRSDHSFS